MPIGRIQRDAHAILQYLSIIGQTERPTAIEDYVRGTVDMLPFYGVGLINGVSTTATVQNPGDTVDVDVPTGENWLLVGAQCSVVTGAANETARLAIVVRARNNQRIRVHTGPELFPGPATVAGSIISLAMTFPQPVLLTAGMGLRMSLEMSGLIAARTANVAGLVYQFTD